MAEFTPFLSSMTGVPWSFSPLKTKVLVFPHLALGFTEHVWPTIFHSDLRECNNSDDSDLLYKVTVRGACQGTIFPDRLLICHSYCCGYCMTVHVLSSSCPLTFMFHLIILFFLGVNNINIWPWCLFEWKPGLWWRRISQVFISDRKTVANFNIYVTAIFSEVWMERERFENATAEMLSLIYRM